MALSVLTKIGALLLTIGALAQAQESIFKALDQDITLVPQYTGSPSEINWKVNGDKLVDMEMNPLHVHFYRLEDRATIDKTNGRLTITKLNKGDSGLYKAEVLVNNIIQETNINLIVLEPPAEPIITNRTIDEKTIELTCKSSTPDVKYEWWNNTKSLSNQQSYNASRSSEDVTLTCVVYNEASRINTTVIVPHIVSGRSGGVIAGILIPLIFIIIIILLLICFSKYRWAERIRERLPSFKSKKTNGDQNGGGTQGEARPFIEIQEGGNRNDVESGNAANKTNGEQNTIGTQEEIDDPSLIGFLGGSGSDAESGNAEVCGSVSLKLLSVGEVQSMKLYKDVMSVSATLGHPGIIKCLALTVDNVEDPEDYTATIILLNGKTRVCTMKGGSGNDAESGKAGADDITWITSVGGKVKLLVTNKGDVKTIDLKKGDKTPYHLAVEGQRVQINDITLEPESLTIKNLKPKDGGTFKVDIRSTDNISTSNTFTLKANELLQNFPDKRTIELKVEREVTPENGLPEDEPIGNITFHPINITNVASIAWKKENKPVDTNDHRIQVGQQGDLVINVVTSEDAGSYTVHSEGQTLEQEFILVL